MTATSDHVERIVAHMSHPKRRSDEVVGSVTPSRSLMA
jgi:hypothetical protein